jgi:hypothetical protein
MTLNDFSLLLLPVLNLEVDRHQDNQQHDHKLATNSSPQTRNISWRIHRAKGRGSEDTTDGTETDLESRADTALRVHADVVTLVRQHSWHVALGTSQPEKGTKVPDTDAGGVCSAGQPHDADNRLGKDDRTSHAHLVCEVCHSESDNARKNVRGRREKLRHSGTEAHTLQKDGKEVAEGIGGHGRAQEDNGAGSWLAR